MGSVPAQVCVILRMSNVRETVSLYPVTDGRPQDDSGRMSKAGHMGISTAFTREGRHLVGPVAGNCRREAARVPASAQRREA